MDSLRYRINRSIFVHSVFRTAEYVFYYEDMSVTILREQAKKGTFVQHFVGVEFVNSKTEAVEMILSYLTALGEK